MIRERLRLSAPLGGATLVSLGALACVQLSLGGDQGQDEQSSGAAEQSGAEDPPETGEGQSGDGESGDGESGDGEPGSGSITGLDEVAHLSDGDGAQAVASLALDPSGARVVAALADKRIVAFTVADASAATVHTIGDGDLFEAGAAVWGGQGFALGTFNGCLLFDDAGVSTHELPGRCSHLGLSGDGQTLVRTTGDGVAAHGFVSGEIQASATVAGVEGLALDSDFVHLLVNGESGYAIESRALPTLDLAQTHAHDVRGLFGGPPHGTLNYADAKLWPDFGGAPVTLATAGLEDQKRIALTADRKWAATLGFSEGIHVFDASDGRRLASATLDVGTGTGLAFDPSAQRLFAGTSTGVHVFEIRRD